MSVRVTGADTCRRQLRELEAFARSRKPMEAIVKDVRQVVLDKTAAGHDYRGRNFPSYSKAYKERRAKMGLGTKPDLSVTGTMMGSIGTAVLTPNHGRVYVKAMPAGKIRTDMLAQIHTTGTGKQPRREFMNITPAALRKLVKKHYDDPLLEIVKRYR